MKILTKTCATLLLLSLAWSCTEEIQTGIDSSKVPPRNVEYDANNSSATVLGFYWEADEAIAAGAVSFTAQIIQDEELGGNVYNSKNSQTIQVSSTLNDGAIFTGLSKNAKYYARVRANYPRSVYSEWVYVLNPDGEKAVIKVGTGIVDEDIEMISGASARFVTSSPSTVVVEWSLTNFSNVEIDQATDCSIELYKDSDCSQLEVSWDIAAGSGLYLYQPRFIFSGLQPGTSYWFVAELRYKEGNNEELTVSRSKPLEVTTEAKKAIPMPANGTPGETILYQDFSELPWGGDLVNFAVGYSSEERSRVTALMDAKGKNPIGGDYGFYLCKPSTEMGLFNTISKAIYGSKISLTEWAELREDPSKKGTIVARPGMIKLGASNKVASIVTPELSALTQTATIELTFKASPYSGDGTKIDPLGTSIRIIEGATIKSNVITGYTSNNIVHSFDLDNEFKFKEYTFTIDNVSPTSRIAIGAERPDGETGQHRLIVDDIAIKIIEYKETAIQ